MAYRPPHPALYGISLFDDLHNFLPELLYDEELSSEHSYRLMRTRLRFLFPDVYAREQRAYTLSFAQAAFRQWRERPVGLPSVAATSTITTAATVAATSTITTATTNTVAEATTPARSSAPSEEGSSRSPPFVRMRSQQRRVYALPNSYPDISLNTTDLLGTNTLMQALFQAMAPGAALYEDVAVAPAQRDLDANTLLVEDAEVPPDEICAVCQYRDSLSESTQWRRLRCEHIFHRPCVDRWFTESVFCPVCRFDVRTESTEEPPHRIA